MVRWAEEERDVTERGRAESHVRTPKVRDIGEEALM